MALTRAQQEAKGYTYLGPDAFKQAVAAGKKVVREGNNYYLAPPSSSPATGAAAGLTGEFKVIYDESKALLDELKKRGQVINPNIEITPEKMAEFTKIAESEIDPYYSTQFKLAREGFLESLGYDRDAVLRNEASLERQYARAHRAIGEQAADVGFAQSGRRQREEGELTDDVQRTIFEGRNELTSRSNELARAFGQTYGGSGLRNIQAEGLGLDISNAPRVGDGNLVKQSTRGPLYQLSPDIYDQLIGSSEFQQRASVRSRASELESAFRGQQALAQERQLSL